MARSRNKYSRAAMRSRYRKPKRRQSYPWFYTALALVVIAGILAIVLTKSGTKSSDVPPRPANAATGFPGDHWHAALGVNICGEWLPFQAQSTVVAGNPNVYAGLHTHGDGFVHIEPASRADSGDNATLGRYVRYMGWKLSSDSVEGWVAPSFQPDKKAWSDGDRCPKGSPDAGKNGQLVWYLNCKASSGDPSDHKISDGDVIAVAFVPKSEKVGVPPSASGNPFKESGQGSFAFNNPECAKVLGSTTTSSLAPPSSEPSSTAPTPTTSTP